ncbi:MAG: archaemetzincin family Zn-dependent metalloprotease [Hydrogenobacter sp.]
MYIYVVSFESIEKRLLFAVAKNIKETFGLEVRVSSVASPFKYAYDPQRKQYRAEKVVEYLSTLNYPGLVKIMALLSSDMYAQDVHFVLGFARKREAVVSTFRLLSPNERLFFERVFKKVNQKLGHTFGLKHCQNQGCVMNVSLSIDTKNKHFCHQCKKELETALSQLAF